MFVISLIAIAACLWGAIDCAMRARFGYAAAGMTGALVWGLVALMVAPGGLVLL